MCVVGLILALAIRPDPRTIAFELERSSSASGESPTREPAEPLGQILRRPGVPAAVLAAIASFAVMAGVMNLTGYIVVGHDHDQADVFTVISLHIVGMFGLVLVVGQLVDRIGRHRALIGGLVIMALSTVMLAWVVAIPSMSFSLFLLGLGWNVSYVAASAELVTHARPVERGRLVGFTDLAAGLTAAALALLGGLAYSEWGVVAIAVGATVAVVAPAVVISVARRPPAPALEPAGCARRRVGALEDG
jgi:MFS family permease